MIRKKKILLNSLTDDEQHKLIEQFANEHSVAIGGHIRVRHNGFSTGMTPCAGYTGFKFEDSDYLSNVINGANQFFYWLRRKQEDATKTPKGK